MATWYVRTDGSDANTPTGNELPPIDGNVAFQTLQHALDSGSNTGLADGDTVVLCADATHSYTSDIILDTVIGSNSSPLVLTGGQADGTVDGTEATIDFSATASQIEFPRVVTGGYTVFKHLEITNSTTDGINFNVNSSALYLIDCRIHGHGNHGVFSNGGTSAELTAIACSFYDNAGAGLTAASNRYHFGMLYDCDFYRNDSYGVYSLLPPAASKKIVVGNRFFDNGNDALVITKGGTTGNSWAYALIANNTFDNNNRNATSDAINVDVVTTENQPIVIANNAISNNTGHGLNLNAASPNLFYLLNNLFYNNTQGHFSDTLSLTDFPFQFSNIVDSNPNYISNTKPSEDYEPQDGAPLVGAGRPGTTVVGDGNMDIGALQRRLGSGGAGGGLLIHPGMTGGVRG